MGVIEFYEEYFGLEKIVNHIREFGCSPISIDRASKFCEKENIELYEDLNNRDLVKIMLKYIHPNILK